jgi:hypothetical protein
MLSFICSYPTAATPVPPSKTEKSPNYPLFIGLYHYWIGTNDSEDLSFMKGDLMYIINHVNNDWWYARKKFSGEEGYIPSNYVTKYTST